MSITVKSLFNRDMIIQVKAVINKIALLDKNKSLNQAAKNLEEDDKTKHNYKTKPTYNLHGPGRYINLCKVIQVQAKSMKAIWSSNCGVGDCNKFMNANKCLADGKYLNTFSASTVAKSLKFKDNSKDKAKAKEDSDS